MKTTQRAQKCPKGFTAGLSFSRIIPLLLCCAAFSLVKAELSACAMSAIMAMPGHTLSEFQPNGSARDYRNYDDPWDYLGFVMANSSAYTNEDGYGMVAYAENEPYLNSRRMWYKRIREAADFGNVYYTGHYLNQEEIQDIWNYDILDNALFALQHGEEPAKLVMCHARNASGITYGNHPFTFERRGRTFSFMHNGNCNVARSYMIDQINLMNPGTNWFNQYPSNYFRQSNPLLWVDTEVMFHYIMSHIINSQDNVLAGLNKALAGIRHYTGNPNSGVYNFMMSDGSNLYVFRSTPVSGSNSHYKLSYRAFRDSFYGVRTQAPLEGDIELQAQELVVFSQDQLPRHFQNFGLATLQHFGEDIEYTRYRNPNELPVSEISISPNPFRGSTSFRIKLATATRLVFRIFNARGETVWQSQQDIGQPGPASINWDGTDKQGRNVSAGLYFYKAEMGNEVQTGRLIKVQ